MANDWRQKALATLDEVRAEIDAAAEPTAVVVLTIGEADMLKERPVGIAANLTRPALHRMLAYAAWRTSLESYLSAEHPHG